jgi:tRNA dimethylallyltransferase
MDSMQVYRGMDIGTAKPSLHERANIPHHLIDRVNPDEQYDAARFVQDALCAMDAIAARGKTVLLTGGTGLYLKALLEGLFETLPTNRLIREQLWQRLEQEGREALHAELARRDPAAGARIHPNDTQRLVRGLEIFYSSGKTWTELIREQGQTGQGRVVFQRLYMAALHCDKEELHQRISQRSQAMLEAGLLAEVEGLRQRGYGADLPSMQAIGYRHVNTFLAGGWSKAEMMERLILDTRRYAKRQMTWFRAIKTLSWFQRHEEERLFAAIHTKYHHWSKNEQGRGLAV